MNSTKSLYADVWGKALKALHNTMNRVFDIQYIRRPLFERHLKITFINGMAELLNLFNV